MRLFWGALRCVVGVLMLAVGIVAAVPMTWALVWYPASSDRALAVTVGMVAAGLVAVAVGGWLLWPGLRGFLAAQRRRSRGTRVALWTATGIGGTVAALSLAVLTLGFIQSDTAVRQCISVVFPADGERCAHWFQDCVAAGNCRYNSYWHSRYYQLFEPPADKFEEFEKAMRDCHVRLGWTDFNNPEHRAAVAADWEVWWSYYEARMDFRHGRPQERGGPLRGSKGTM